MDRSPFLDFAEERTWEQCQYQNPSLLPLFREIDLVAALVQQQSVIGFSLENFATTIFEGTGNFSPVTGIDLSGLT
jgi:hypothetical protein